MQEFFPVFFLLLWRAQLQMSLDKPRKVTQNRPNVSPHGLLHPLASQQNMDTHNQKSTTTNTADIIGTFTAFVT